MLYHVSLEPIKKFTLRVPQQRLDNEDSITKRICFSKSLEGALSAMPKGKEILDGLFVLKKENNLRPYFHIYMIDEKTLKAEDIVQSEILTQTYKVLDATFTEEVWLLTDKLNLIHKVIEIDNFAYEQKIIPEGAITLIKDLKYEMFNFSKKDLTSFTNKQLLYIFFWVNFKKRYKKRIKKHIQIETICSYLSSLSN